MDFNDNKNGKEYNEYLREMFASNLQLLESLKRLQDKKEEIKELKKERGDIPRTIVVTISGTPRAGKTTCINNLFDFLKKANLKTTCLEEPAGLIYQTLKSREEKKELLKDRVGFVDRQYEIGDDYITRSLSDNEIILCDRGIIDTFIWYQMYYKRGMMSEERYQEFMRKMQAEIPYLNIFYALYAEADVSMKRDYFNSLSIEERTTMNYNNVLRYNEAMMSLMPDFGGIMDSVQIVDTSAMPILEPSIVLADRILARVRKLYLEGK